MPPKPRQPRQTKRRRVNSPVENPVLESESQAPLVNQETVTSVASNLATQIDYAELAKHIVAQQRQGTQETTNLSGGQDKDTHGQQELCSNIEQTNRNVDSQEVSATSLGTLLDNVFSEVMGSEIYLREKRFNQQVGNVVLDFVTVDGIGFGAAVAAELKGGISQRIKDVLNFNSGPNDVLLANYPKCGTHWVNEVLQMLIQGNSKYSKEEKMTTMLELVPDLERMARLKSPKIFNTHLPYKWLPRKHIENGGKIVHVTRNPKDAYVSYYFHNKRSLEHGTKTKNMTWAQYFESCVIGKNSLWGSWFDYEKEMDLAKKQNKNIYTVHFELLKENPEREVKALSQFLNIETSECLVKEIAKKCQFESLKKADAEIKEMTPELKDLFAKISNKHPESKLPFFYRKGMVGDWKNHFTVAQNEEFNALFTREMKGTHLKVIFS